MTRPNVYRGPQENDICRFCKKGALRPLSYFGKPDNGKWLKCDNLESDDPRCHYAISTRVNVKHVRPATDSMARPVVGALYHYSQLADTERFRSYLNCYPTPLDQELVEIADLVAKYRNVFTAENAEKIMREIQKITFAADGQGQLTAIVKREEPLISTALAFRKKHLHYTKKIMSEVLGGWQASLINFDHQIGGIDNIAKMFDQKLPF